MKAMSSIPLRRLAAEPPQAEAPNVVKVLGIG